VKDKLQYTMEANQIYLTEEQSTNKFVSH